MNAFSDLFFGLARWRLWWALAIEEFRLRYHRTLFGTGWVVASFVLFIVVKIFVFSELSQEDSTYYSVHVILGYMVWTYLAQALNSGAISFINSRNWILGISMPYSVLIFRDLVVCILNYFFVSVSAILLMVYFMPLNPEFLLWAIIGSLAMALSLLWVQLALATFAVFVRDCVPFTATTMRLAFFLSPVIWVQSDLGSKGALMNYNPFTHYLAIVRAPLLDGEIPIESWKIVGVISAAAFFTSLTMFQIARKRITSFV